MNPTDPNQKPVDPSAPTTPVDQPAAETGTPPAPTMPDPNAQVGSDAPVTAPEPGTNVPAGDGSQPIPTPPAEEPKTGGM